MKVPLLFNRIAVAGPEKAITGPFPVRTMRETCGIIAMNHRKMKAAAMGAVYNQV